jgi:hypothetical protein
MYGGAITILALALGRRLGPTAGLHVVVKRKSCLAKNRTLVVQPIA